MTFISLLITFNFGQSEICKKICEKSLFKTLYEATTGLQIDTGQGSNLTTHLVCVYLPSCCFFFFEQQENSHISALEDVTDFLPSLPINL